MLQVLPSAALGYFSYETTKRLLEKHFVPHSPTSVRAAVA
jgi:hypothetical protein